MIKKLRLSKPVGGGRPVVFPTRDTDGGKEIGERKTDRDRQDDQERQKGKERDRERSERFIRNKMQYLSIVHPDGSSSSTYANDE